MIGRTETLTGFELARWARLMARKHELAPREAHVLLILATYANPDGVAWPSLQTIARDAGLKPKADGRCSTVSAALARLEELRLVWTTHGGRGATARRELLVDPAELMGSATTEPNDTLDKRAGFRPDGPKGSVRTEPEQPGEQPTTPNSKSQRMGSAVAEPISPPPPKVRRAIVASHAEARRRREDALDRPPSDGTPAERSASVPD
jgi:hypothetical protein